MKILPVIIAGIKDNMLTFGTWVKIITGFYIGCNGFIMTQKNPVISFEPIKREWQYTIELDCKNKHGKTFKKIYDKDVIFVRRIKKEKT